MSSAATAKHDNKSKATPSRHAPSEAAPANESVGASAGLPLFLGGLGESGLVAGPGLIGIQTKLTVNAPGDGFEQEAEHVADAVERQNGRPQKLQGVSRAPEHHEPVSLSQERTAPAAAGETIADPEIARHIKSPHGGHSLPHDLRRQMESSLGADFSKVRIHDNPVDRDYADQLNAKAFTHGRDIWVGSAGSVSDRKLMAHELTHVVQQGAGQSSVVQRQTKVQQGTDVGETDAVPPVEDVFAGKSYDRKTKDGALEYAKDWHTQYLRNYQPYMTPAYDKAPGDVGISFTKQQRVGRAFFIYTEFYWPQIQKLADTVSPAAVFQVINDDVNATNEECETEEESSKRINPASYRTLFPETFAKEYDAEAHKAREEAAKERESDEKWKVDAATRKDKEAFVLFGGGEYRPVFYAEMLEAEAERIRKGQWSSLGFSDQKVFFWVDADTKAANVAESEYNAYIERAENPDKAWTEALETTEQWRGDLNKQNKDDADTSAAEKDLVQLTIVASLMRNKAGRDVLPGEVIDAWNAADQALIAIAPVVAKDELSDSLQEATKLPVELFFEEFWADVVAPDGPVKDEELDDMILDARTDLQHANNKDGWKVVFADYNEVVEAMDNQIAAELEKKGRKDEADQLKAVGGRAMALTELLQEHRNAQKVQAVFYPEDKLDNAGEPGKPSFTAQGIQLLFYLYREDGDWNLADVTTPHQVKVTSGSGGSADKPDMSIFSDVNSKLRFPTGRIYFYLPDGTAWMQACTEPWRLSEWLTWIGLGAAAIGLAIVTLGASIPAELILFGAAVGVAAGVSDFLEKKTAGVLTTKDIAVDGLQIVASLLTAGSAKLGQIVVSRAVATGVGLAEVGGMAGKLFIPVTLAAAGADVTSFAVMASDTIAALKAIDEQPGSAEDKKMSRLRLVAQLIGMGAITFFGVRGSMKAARIGADMHIGAGASGELSASALLTDEELLQSAKGLKNSADIGKLLADESLPQELRDRIRAGLSQAVTNGPIAPRKLDELLAKLRTATSLEEQNAVLAEMAARSRIGALSDGEVAARVTAKEAAAIAQLKDEALQSLKGATPRDLKSLAAVLDADPKEGARLITEYGPEIIDYLRTNPLPSLGALEDILAKQRSQVAERVRGFAEGVDTNNPPEGGWKFNDGRGVYLDSDGVTKVIETKVTGPNGATGYFERAYNPITRQLELRMAFLRMKGQKKALPSIIPKQGSSPEMIAGKGSPTVQYISIYQMKLLGVPLGDAAAGVRSIHMSDIQNLETIVHLHWLKQQFPSNSLEELIEFTASVKYAETTATQTGYKRSGRPTIAGGRDSEIRELMAFQENGKPELIAQNKALLERYGFTRKTVMHWGFDIDFPVMSQP